MRALLLAACAVLCPALALGATVPVAIHDYAFGPKTVMVHPGDTVVWTNTDSVPHTVAALGGGFVSGALAPGGTYRHVFAATGRFAYRCGIHPEMQGTVVVAPTP